VVPEVTECEDKYPPAVRVLKVPVADCDEQRDYPAAV